MMFRKDIIIYDAICIVILMEHCINTGLFDENYPIVMSRQMYEKAKDEALTKLGLDPSYFSEEFDSYTVNKLKDQVNAMGEETRMNLDTSYYNGEKTEYTCVDPRTHDNHGTYTGGVKHEPGAHGMTAPHDGTTYHEHTVVADKDMSEVPKNRGNHSPSQDSSYSGYGRSRKRVEVDIDGDGLEKDEFKEQDIKRELNTQSQSALEKLEQFKQELSMRNQDD